MEAGLRLKSDLFKGSQTFSIDFGGSVLKLVYLTQDREDESFTLVKCVSFARQDLQKAIEFIKKEVKLPQPQEDGQLPRVLFTGIGMHEFSDTIESQLNIRTSVIWEGDCILKAVKLLLSDVSDGKQLFHKNNFSKGEELKDSHRSWRKLFIEAGNEIPEGNVEDHTPEDWPVMLVTFGSAITYKMVHADGKMRDLTFSPRGGRQFLGLGSLLTGAKSYEELIELAKNGDQKNVNIYFHDLTKTYQKKDQGEEHKQNVYTVGQIDVNIFSYGSGVGKTISDYRREDLAQAVLYNTIQDCVMDMLLICADKKLTNVVMIGGFPTNPYVRNIMDEEFLRAQVPYHIMEPGTAPSKATCRTLVWGNYAGALGALLNSFDFMKLSSS